MIKGIMAILETLSFMFFLTMLLVGGFVIAPYYFVRYVYES